MRDSEFKRFLRYCVVGGIGFCVDAGILQFGIYVLGLDPLSARVPSFLIAVLATWYLNRGFTFRMHGMSFLKSFPLYISANAIGLAVNFGAYSAGVLLSPLMAKWTLIPLAIGSVLGLAFNFVSARLIFRAPPE